MKKKVRGKREEVRGEARTVSVPPPEKYEVFVGNELAIQAIWKVIYPACPGECDVASLLTNRAYSRGIPLCQLKDKSRDELIKLVLIEQVKKGGAK